MTKNKKCSKCKNILLAEASNFYRSSRRIDGFRSSCKKCDNKQKKEYYQQEAVKLSKQSNCRKYYSENKCQILKHKKEYRLNNAEQYINKDKNYYLENRDRILEQKKEYNNRKEVKLQRNKRERKIYKDNPEKKIRMNVTNAVYYGLKNTGGTKNASTWSALSYTPLQLKEHLESQFEDWMSWDNHGKFNSQEKTWQVDHIYPHSKLPYDSLDHPNFKKCWALSNLQPLCALENIRKGNKIISEEQIK